MEKGKMLGKSIQDELKLATHGVIINSETFAKYYLPLIQHYIEDRKKRKINTYVIGLQGCQGIGKTVLTTLIKLFLRSIGYKVTGFSLDNFYKSNDERLEMAKTYEGNPFYQIPRGLPGTHDYEKLFDVLKKTKNGEPFEIPDFDKSLYNGRGDITGNVTQVHEQQDFVILEGWFVNMPYVEPSEFQSIMKQNEYVSNVFEELDPKYEHFGVVMDYIKQYQKVWALFDNKTFMLGKKIEWVQEWRTKQEEKLIATKGSGMTGEEFNRYLKPHIPFTYFVHERISRTTDGVDCLLTIGKNHIPEGIKIYSSNR